MDLCMYGGLAREGMSISTDTLIQPPLTAGENFYGNKPRHHRKASQSLTFNTNF